ncbi:MAG: hypothetical protein DMG76_00985 [Acidobacteria bacterium]|nr:MAG: hypothetical protein DMG76_00985 [Acidobacteriota bacterium]
MPPTLANGKICYVEMPTTDVARSAEFYKHVFGWNIRKRRDGSTSCFMPRRLWQTMPRIASLA